MDQRSPEKRVLRWQLRLLSEASPIHLTENDVEGAEHGGDVG
jgi:hypothetical protein